MQAQSALLSPGLNQANLQNLDQLGAAGQALQGQSQNQINAAMNQWSYNQNLPLNNLTNYMNLANSL
ncbi:hypothetical protein [Dyella sp. Tek66A03]|uniref:hypothetical protein n=1 Tax=Dyella sp. Tek66A03 TaxID=3458298 RepID=UPI00403E9563